MDVTGFLCVSLDSSTVQLHDSLGSRRVFACSDLVSVVKMTTVLEECNTEEQLSVLRFSVGKRIQCKIFS
jgi:EAL domain-containing protein (putative c-di-GMP-specific phosphodiesterase class I)